MSDVYTVSKTDIYKDFPFRDYIEYDFVKKRQMIDVAGEYIYKRLLKFGNYPKDYELFVQGSMRSDLNDLCFRFGNKTYSVLVEILGEYRKDSEVKRQFIKHCKENNLIACFFPVTPKLLKTDNGSCYGLWVGEDGVPNFTFEIGDFGEIIEESYSIISYTNIDNRNNVKIDNIIKQCEDINNWNLINAITYEPVIPTDLVTNEIINLSLYEQKLLSIWNAIDFLKDNHNVVLGYSDIVCPQILYKNSEDEDGFVWVKTFETDEEFDEVTDSVHLKFIEKCMPSLYMGAKEGWFYGMKFKDLSRTGERTYKYKRYSVKNYRDTKEGLILDLYVD